MQNRHFLVTLGGLQSEPIEAHFALESILIWGSFCIVQDSGLLSEIIIDIINKIPMMT